VYHLDRLNYWHIFENVDKFKYLVTTVTDQNVFHEDIESELNPGNALPPFSPEPFVFSSAL
jgi:hypothetical protein